MPPPGLVPDSRVKLHPFCPHWLLAWSLFCLHSLLLSLFPQGNVAVAVPQSAAPPSTTNGAAASNGAAAGAEVAAGAAGADGEASTEASTAVTSAPSEHADLYADTDAVASLSKEDVEQLLRSTGQDATLLVLYAPWCRFCQVRHTEGRRGREQGADLADKARQWRA